MSSPPSNRFSSRGSSISCSSLSTACWCHTSLTTVKTQKQGEETQRDTWDGGLSETTAPSRGVLPCLVGWRRTYAPARGRGWSSEGWRWSSGWGSPARPPPTCPFVRGSGCCNRAPLVWRVITRVIRGHYGKENRLITGTNIESDTAIQTQCGAALPLPHFKIEQKMTVQFAAVNDFWWTSTSTCNRFLIIPHENWTRPLLPTTRGLFEVWNTWFMWIIISHQAPPPERWGHVSPRPTPVCVDARNSRQASHFKGKDAEGDVPCYPQKWKSDWGLTSGARARPFPDLAQTPKVFTKHAKRLRKSQ